LAHAQHHIGQGEKKRDPVPGPNMPSLKNGLPEITALGKAFCHYLGARVRFAGFVQNEVDRD